MASQVPKQQKPVNLDPMKPLDDGVYVDPTAGEGNKVGIVNSTASLNPAPTPAPGGPDQPAPPVSPATPAQAAEPATDAAPTPEPANGTVGPETGGIDPAPPAPTPPTNPGGPGAWTPSEGLVDGVMQAETQTVTGTGYTPGAMPTAQGYDPTKYNAEGYVPEKVTENLSQAVNRIADENGVLMQRAGAAGERAAAGRGLVNSTMAVQAAQAAMLDQAIPIAQGDVQTGMFNAQQANDAARFTADAKNRASEFAAAAENAAKQFGAGEANKMAMFAAEQFNIAARFAADAENAAKQFNATAYNAARQKYVDAVNAAKAAQTDAENLSRRDAATFTQQRELQRMQGETARATANAGYNASMATARMRQESDAAALAAQQRENQLNREQRAGEFDTNTRMAIDQMGQGAFERYQAGMNALNLAEMEPEARQNAIHNYNAMWAGNPYLPVTINMDAFPPATPAAP